MCNSSYIEGIIITPQKIIDVPGGNVYHGMRASDPGYANFGEAYFSTIEYKAIKGWKRHRDMTLNLVVPRGAIRFVIYDDRSDSLSHGVFQEVTLSQQHYCRLTVPPNLWMGFQGASVQSSLLLNIANLEHHPEETDRAELDQIKFRWE
jgi:dTDP-4-dehydrorhamnose 3,5-epimerase